jgi:hypothetical protein
MELKKCAGFSFILMAIVFLFLSSASLFASGLKISFENSKDANSCLIQNPVEAAEESCLQTSSFEAHDNDFSLRHSSPHRLFKKERNSIVIDFQEWQPKFSFISYSHLLRPYYYHFLFRHNLF